MKPAARACLVLTVLAIAVLLPVAIYIFHLGSPPTIPQKTATHAFPHERIVIQDPGDFTVPGAGTGCECVRGGSGDSSHPFVISGWRLNASDGHGISIAWTTVHFLIADVIVNGSGRYSGVVLRGVENGVIMNSSFSGGLHGIYLFRSSNIMIANNTVADNDFGIILEGSENNTVAGNALNRNRQVGIFVRGSNDVIDANLVVDGSFGGINVDGTGGFGSSNRITNNVVNRNLQYGIGLWRARNNLITGNVVSENGATGIMLVDSSANNLIESNRVVNNRGDGVLIAEQSSGNRVTRNTVTGNGNAVNSFDLNDECSDNVWLDNIFDTRKPETIT